MRVLEQFTKGTKWSQVWSLAAVPEITYSSWAAAYQKPDSPKLPRTSSCGIGLLPGVRENTTVLIIATQKCPLGSELLTTIKIVAQMNKLQYKRKKLQMHLSCDLYVYFLLFTVQA